MRWKIRDESGERAILIIKESRRTTNSKREFLSRGCRAIKSRDLKFGKKQGLDLIEPAADIECTVF